ncbi:hypothetical protein [Sinorhizobium mexicanum]|uniref:hypothetical protein n=1 Tax=Sinorhizobium mexicanum TaxID=375549 RepID=UPI0015DF623C|nr:hypothetical protein [Sinorhizobium mexicanum]MBP1886351.1 hypothetical protein [Sinorhizobium mexicanum]
MPRKQTGLWSPEWYQDALVVLTLTRDASNSAEREELVKFTLLPGTHQYRQSRAG